jgi:phosphatidylglycerophosphate synthase
MSLGWLMATLFGRRTRCAEHGLRESSWTYATALTVARALITSVIFVLAVLWRSHEWLLIALGMSMCADFLDGFIARTGRTETVLGAQLDGMADRLATTFVIAGVLTMDHGASTAIVAGLVWLQFGVVDQFLTSQFLRFGLWSPDHFYAIEETVWQLNWSPPAKLASNLPIVLLAIGSWCIWPAAALASALIALRLAVYPAMRAQARARIKEQGLAYTAPLSIEAEPVSGDIQARRLSASDETSLPPVYARGR